VMISTMIFNSFIEVFISKISTFSDSLFSEFLFYILYYIPYFAWLFICILFEVIDFLKNLIRNLCLTFHLLWYLWIHLSKCYKFLEKSWPYS
jgi:hypothetical protein